MAWDFFGVDAIRFAPADLVLRELVDAINERGGAFHPIPSGARLSGEGIKNIIQGVEKWCNENLSRFVDYRKVYGKTKLEAKVEVINTNYFDYMGVEQISYRAKGWLLNAEWAAQMQEVLDFARCTPIRMLGTLEARIKDSRVEAEHRLSANPSKEAALNILRTTNSFEYSPLTLREHDARVEIRMSNYNGYVELPLINMPEGFPPFEAHCCYRMTPLSTTAHFEGIDDGDTEHFFPLSVIDCGIPGYQHCIPAEGRATMDFTPKNPAATGSHGFDLDETIFVRMDTPGGLKKVNPIIIGENNE